MTKPHMEFFDSPAIYIILVLACDIPALCLLYIFIGTFNPLDVLWWIAVFMIYGFAILFTFGYYPLLMSKIRLSPDGLRKSVFQKFFKQEFSWNDVQDCRIYVRPNGYAYIIVGTKIIETESFSKIKKDKAHYIYFSHRQEAFDYIMNQWKNASHDTNLSCKKEES